MSIQIPSTRPLCCWKSVFREARQAKSMRRSLATLQSHRHERVQLPPKLPAQFWPQLPPALRPDNAPKKVKIYPPPPTPLSTTKDPIGAITASQLSALDPTGARKSLFSYTNPEGVKVGDILLVTFKTGDPFAGVCMNIRSRGVDTAVLLRNELTRVGCEMWVKVYSPNVEGVEVVQRSEKRKRRARLYYLRKPKHNVGSVQGVVQQYLRKRSALASGTWKSQSGYTPKRKGKKR